MGIDISSLASYRLDITLRKSAGDDAENAAMRGHHPLAGEERHHDHCGEADSAQS
jgi:hypothetical protein